MPAGRRDWAEAIWAEAYEVPSGFRRLAWRAGGVRVIAREALLARMIGRCLLFAVAAALATRANWPGPPGRFATAIARMDVVTTVLLLAGLPLLARRFLGPAINSRLARFLRAGGYAAILALMVAKASVLRGVPAETGPALQFDWFAQIVFLVVMAGYVAAILAMTAPRSRVAPATLAAGTGAGIALGVVMYAVAPLGLTNDATEPWLPGAAIDPVVVLAWILLLGGPVVAGAVAVLRYRGPGSPQQVTGVRIWQGGAAGFLATGIGGLMVTVLGTGTVALMPRAAWLRNLLVLVSICSQPSPTATSSPPARGSGVTGSSCWPSRSSGSSWACSAWPLATRRPRPAHRRAVAARPVLSRFRIRRIAVWRPTRE